MNRPTLHDRILASLSLAGIGDALGAPTEQCTMDEIAARYGGLVTRFDEPPEDTFAGANGGRRAEVTDDASQMYHLARALIAAGGRLDTEGWIACLLDWVRTSPKSAFMGPSTAGIVKALQEGLDPAGVGVIGTSRRKMSSVGTTNGAAMRVAPAGLIHPGRIEAACEQALLTCLPSHDTQVAISAACSVAAAVAQALVARSFDELIEAALAGATLGERLAREHARVVAGPSHLARLEMALAIAHEEHDDERFMRRMERTVGNSVLAAESVPAALGIVAYAKGDPLRTVALGASIGNDSDTIATMAGAIVGAWTGTEALPQALLAEFRAVNAAAFDLDGLAAGLAAITARP